MASKLRQRTRSKRKTKTKAARKRSQKQADTNRGIAAARASGKRKKSKSQYLTGRDAAASTASKGTNQSSLQQSVGSLDRRVEKALAEGNTELAKDLRSRQNKFVKQLGLERAKQSMLSAAPLNKKEQIRKQLKANPNFLSTKGFDVFEETIDQDYIDPTRKLQNIYPDQFRKMYPFTAAMQGGLPTIRLAKKAFGVEDKPIPYNLEDMPGIRYPLDAVPVRTRSDRQSPLDENPFTISDRQPGLDWEKPTLPRKDEVTDKDIQAAIDRGISPEFIFPISDDPSTEIIEQGASDGTALQLAEAANTQGDLTGIVEEVTNQKNLNKFPYQNVFALPEQVKEKFINDAEVNRKTYEMETYGKEITSEDLAKAGVNETFYNQSYDNPIIEKQLFQAGIIKEKDVQAPIIKDVEAAKSGNLAGQVAAVPLDVAGFMGANLVPGYTDMTDYVREKAFVPQTQYTGEEWTNKVAGDKELALQNINNSMELDDVQKSSLIDFVNQGGVDTNPVYMAGTDVQTNDPWKFHSDPVVFDEYVQERLNKLR